MNMFMNISRSAAGCVPKGIAGNCEFVAKFCEEGGLKNRRLAACKMSIAEVLISLSLCGEVAERLKAAVG